jgi:hypothetical protein
MLTFIFSKQGKQAKNINFIALHERRHLYGFQWLELSEHNPLLHLIPKVPIHTEQQNADINHLPGGNRTGNSIVLTAKTARLLWSAVVPNPATSVAVARAKRELPDDI